MEQENYLTELKKMHRRERYEREVETSFRVFYFGREEELYSYFPQACNVNPFADDEQEQERIRRKALRMALQKYKEINPEGYSYIAERFFGEGASIVEMGHRHHVSRQAISQRISKYIGQLRLIVLDYMKFLGA